MKQNYSNPLIKLLLLLIFGCSTAFSQDDSADIKSQKEILHLLQKWPQDFNTQNIQATCGLFAPDLIASYQGTPDRNYEEMCSQLTKVLTNNDKIFSYEAPEIEQIIVRDDIGVVRLIWTLKVSSKDQSKTQLTKEKGLDVFKRQKDGSWKIAISYAYPL
jgi:ketosteroid isomerase-like protein